MSRPGVAWRALGALAILFAFAPAVVRGSDAPASLCEERIAHDYRSVFAEMPREHAPPQGELPFGPRNLSLHYVDLGTSVALQGTRFGYRFAAKNEGRRVLHLNWDVEAVLWRLDGDGRQRARVVADSRRLRDVRELDPLEFVFPARTVGLYRLDLRFRKPSGRWLGAYREYFRVVGRSVAISLVSARPRVQPGELAYVQARNAGTAGVVVPQRIPVQRWTGETWETLSAGASITDRTGWWLGIGEAAPCSSFPIPTDASPGHYRFATTARVRGARERRVLTADFEVVAPSAGS